MHKRNQEGRQLGQEVTSMAGELMCWREIDQKTQMFNVRKKNWKSVRPAKT